DSSGLNAETIASSTPSIATRVTIEQLMLAGAHFGHITSRWNPKMKRFIFSEHNGIHIFDLNKTSKLLDKAVQFVVQITSKGEEVLFVGTKPQIRDIVKSEAIRCESPYVTFRWLGGSLTNFSTIRRSVRTLESYERMANDGTYDNLTKKEILHIEKARLKLLRVLEGIRNMKRLPGAIFIVDTLLEKIAVAEANRLQIPIIGIIDSNADPDFIDYPIPANDDSYKSVWLITHTIADAVIEGKRILMETISPVIPEAEGKIPPVKKVRRKKRSQEISDALSPQTPATSQSLEEDSQ
ncbi:MAG: 30S ribosomal protein S2, partial [bacterium]